MIIYIEKAFYIQNVDKVKNKSTLKTLSYL